MAPKPVARKKVEIEYPPVPRKKWIPPEQRPKEPRVPAYVKPKGLNQPLKISSLLKIWHRFVLQKSNRYVLVASFSQTHRRFRLKTNGMQGSCNCIVACMMSRMYKMESWNLNYLNEIMCIGNSLYEKSIAKLGDKSVGAISATQVYPTFYIHRYLITFQIINPGDPFSLTSPIDQNQPADLEKSLTDFFTRYSCGVARLDQRYLALWCYENAYFMFDPTEHQKNADRWNGLVSTGFAVCIRFTKIQYMADYIVSDTAKIRTLKMKIWPVQIMRCQAMALKAPENLDEVKKLNEEFEKMKEESKTFQAKEAHKQALEGAKAKKQTDVAPEQKKSEKLLQQLKTIEEISPEAETAKRRSLLALQKLDKLKVPVEPHVGKPITHFTIIDESKMGIIRASTHQTDPKFSRFRNGEQSLSQAVAALVMRRCFPTCQWIKKFVNDILKLGETIHHKSLKDKPEGPFRLSNIVNQIVHPPGKYTLDFEELALLGKLESERPGLLDLLPALMTFLRTYDCCIINGPCTLAVWYEDNRYYMYDPNERDGKGRTIDKKASYEPGVACITWFTALKDLVALYVANLPKEERRSDFHLSKVIVVDFVGKPENWNNFQGEFSRYYI
ncbi:hypothetical protein HHI36_022368 [Cryptolaemus montrouzieri]|uniref:Uncharacterized protein n=1 Tax=Cryptolaemus montrouzieri TaxID=559131 RepID=A0ABD2MZN3_9CUCU